MEQMSFEYWNKLAEQVLVICSLLGGFSIAVIANFLVSDSNTAISKKIMISAVFAAGFFLISVFAMTKILLLTTSGFPFPVTDKDLGITSIIGGIAFLFGIVSLVTLISLAGWTKSKKMGWLTTAIGVLTLGAIMFLIN